MRRRVRFTFVCDKLNRTATAALIGALEPEFEDSPDAIRVVNPGGALQIDFNQPGQAIEILCMSSMTENFEGVKSLATALWGKFGRGAFSSICGGSHASGRPLDVLRAGFDYCCVGEGEETPTARQRFPELVVTPNKPDGIADGEFYRLGPLLGQAAAAYRDGLPYVATSPLAGAHEPAGYRADTYGEFRGSQHAGFLTIGELANVKGFDGSGVELAHGIEKLTWNNGDGTRKDVGIFTIYAAASADS